mmetsp:Transcript_46462/g.108209  ORF Transcript_46462/g.108209 Transcript_46462/m.108209 type:complete len:1093 (+) Transcript_46462:77-3355(+)
MGGIRQLMKEDVVDKSEASHAIKDRILLAVAAKDRIIERQALVMSLATQVVKETEVSTAVKMLVDATYKVATCERVSLFLIDGGELVCHAAPAGGETGWRLPLGKGVAGRVAETGEVVNIPDAYQCRDGLFDPSYDIKTGYRTRSILCLPLQDQEGCVMGVLQAINKRRDIELDTQAGDFEPFDSIDEQMLQFLLALTVQQLHTCDLISAREKAQEETATVLTLTSAICSNRELGEVVSALAQATQTLLHCQHVLVLLPEKGRWVCRAVSSSSLAKLVGVGLDLEDPSLSQLGTVEKSGEAVMLDQGSEKDLLEELQCRLRSGLQSLIEDSSGLSHINSDGLNCPETAQEEDEDEDEDDEELNICTALCCAIQDQRDAETVGLVLAINKDLDLQALNSFPLPGEVPMTAMISRQDSRDGGSMERVGSLAQRRTSMGKVLDAQQVKALALGSLLEQATGGTMLPHTAEEEFCAFEETDLERLRVLLDLAGHVVKTASLFDKETRANRKISILLTLLRNVQLAIEAKDLSRVSQLISVHALSMFECDRCTFYTVDNFANELIGHFVARVPGEVEERLQEIRVPMEGIAGQVAKTGSVLNIRDAWSDNRFWKQNDLRTGYRTRSILCAPLCASNGKVVAVIQCINKHNFECFNEDDEKVLTQISLLLSDLMQKLLLESSYAAFIHTSTAIAADVKHMYRQFCQEVDSPRSPSTMNRRQSRAVGVEYRFPDRRGSSFTLGGSATASASLTSTEQQYLDSICRWDFDYTAVDDAVSIPLVVEQCFERLGLFTAFPGIAVDSLRSFITELRSLYRTDAAYHNWLHAFITVHATFLTVSRFSWQRVLRILDVFALLLAAIGHDIEHPGFTNAYQVATESPLALLYNDKSVLEQHHAATMCRLMKSSESNFLRAFDSQSLRRIREVIMSSILATDMARHNEMILWLESNHGVISHAESSGDERLSVDTATRVCDSMLHAADLVHPALPWKVHKHLSTLMATEFYIQYEEEQRRGLPSLPFMGKEPGNLVELAPVQVGFLQFVVAPLWKSLNFAVGGERMQFVVQNIDGNSNTWKAVEKGDDVGDDQPHAEPSLASSAKST